MVSFNCYAKVNNIYFQLKSWKEMHLIEVSSFSDCITCSSVLDLKGFSTNTQELYKLLCSLRK